MIKNLGQVAAIYVGKTAPRNVNMIWLDNTVIPYVFKSYNGEEWTEIPTGAWVETYVNGWLVSLQQGTVTTDDDYLLINSGGVNYKMTVRDFVKSSVGNPLDFKGVIRTDSDFPNPSMLEGGDMYIIITEPAGGTVTDPYSGKTFSDSEKIVWDSVINSWASLGKIDVKVDLSTTYSATEVTIHSSAGKETTVVGVTDDNAGVMVPVQKKWLDSLSNGSTLTPQGPSTAPYHKHRYSDIVDRIISQQVTGDSAINPMSQKATTEALDLKLDKSSVLQVSGVSTTDVMSQKAVADAIQTLKSSVDDKLSRYLPLSGGTMTGDLVLSNNKYIKGIVSTGSPIQILGLNSSNTISVGNGSYDLLLYTGASDISHWKGGTSYKIWDASNVSKPLNYVNGTDGRVTSVYTRNLNLNGTNYPFIGTGTTVVTLFAPTTAGTSGQILQSQGAGKAPIWVDGSAGGGGVQLSDDNVWTGLNTFQGGLKTSDGTNTYDVWANDILKYPVKYEINSTGTGYALSFYSKTAGWKEIDTLTTKYLTSATVKSISAGGDGYIGIGTNAYASAAISNINTNSIYFRGLNNTVLSTNDDGKLEYGSSSNYAGFNSGNIRIAYPIVSSSGGGGGGGGGTTDPSEGGLTIGYYPVNTISRVTERAKIYCTTANLYLKDLAKNTQLDFDTDGLYVTTGSTSKVRLATLNDVGGGGSSVSLGGDNTWTGVNIFSGTGLVTNQYDSGNTEIPASAKYSIMLACSGSYNNYGFGAVRSEDRIKQSYAFVQTPSAFFTFDNSGSLYTTIGNTKYEFWNKNNLAKPITYNTNTEGNAILYKGDSASKIDGLVLPRTMPDDSTPNILQGGTGGFGSAEHAYASCHIGAVYTNEIHTYIDNDMTATVNLTMDDTGVYFVKSDGTLYRLTMEVVS